MANAGDIRAGGAYIELGVKNNTAAGFAQAAAAMQGFQANAAGIGASLASAFNVAKFAVPFGGFAALGQVAFSKIVGMAKEAAAHVQQVLSEQMGRSNTLRLRGLRLDIDTSSLQALDYAARKTGAPVEALDIALAQLSRTIGDAQAGNQTAIDAFQRLGLSVGAFKGKDTSQAFNMVADAIRTMHSHTEKASAAQDIFGRGAAALGPLLEKGSEGIRAMGDQAAALGFTLSLIDQEKLNALSKVSKELAATKEAQDKNTAVAFADVQRRMVEAAIEEQKRLTPLYKATAEEAASHYGATAGTVSSLYHNLAAGIGMVLGTVAAGGRTRLDMLAESAKEAAKSIGGLAGGIQTSSSIIDQALLDARKNYRAFQDEAVKAGAAIVESMRTPAEKLAIQLGNLAELRHTLKPGMDEPVLSQEQYERAKGIAEANAHFAATGAGDRARFEQVNRSTEEARRITETVDPISKVMEAIGRARELWRGGFLAGDSLSKYADMMKSSAIGFVNGFQRTGAVGAFGGGMGGYMSPSGHIERLCNVADKQLARLDEMVALTRAELGKAPSMFTGNQRGMLE